MPWDSLSPRRLGAVLGALTLASVAGCVQPKDLDGARTRGWTLGETKVVGTCSYTLTQGWLHEEQGWEGALFVDVVNESDSAATCVAVAALVDVLPEPCSVVSKTFTLAPGASKSWRAPLASPARANVSAARGWAYLGLRSSVMEDEVGHAVHGLPEGFQER